MAVLTKIPIRNEVGAGYTRDAFGYPDDSDHDGCNTRAEVLVRDSSIATTHRSTCTITTGRWLSVYDGKVVVDAAALQIDHVVALKEAWDSGAYAWTPARRDAYGNDLTDRRTLRAVTSATNEEKGDKDPSNWLPPAQADLCPYIGDVVAIKARWGLSMDESEWGRIRNLLAGPCAGWKIAPWRPVATSIPPTAPVHVPVPPSPPVPRTTAAPVPPADDCNPNYDPCVPNASDVDCAGGGGNGPIYVHGPIRVIGVDVYGLDGNGDGIACA